MSEVYELFPSDEIHKMVLPDTPAGKNQWVELKTELTSFDEFLLQSKLVEVQIVQDAAVESQREVALSNPREKKPQRGVKMHFTLAEYQQAQLETWITGGEVYRIDKKSGGEEFMEITDPDVIRGISIPFRRAIRNEIDGLQAAVTQKKGYSLEIEAAPETTTENSSEVPALPAGNGDEPSDEQSAA